MTKCAHNICIRNVAEGNKYCDQCIQIPARECNYCALMVKTENRKLAEEVQSAIDKRGSRTFYLMIACISLVIITLVVIWMWNL